MGAPDDLRTPTPTRKCALAVAIPLTKADFKKDAQPKSNHDFAHSMCGIDEPGEIWERVGKAIAAKAEEVIEIAARCHVQVIREATLYDLAKLFDSAPTVVTIVAHWRDAKLSGRDIEGDPEEILARIENASSNTPARADALREIVTLVKPYMPKVLKHKDEKDRRASFAEALNEAVIDARAPLTGLAPSISGETLMVGNFWLQSWHRKLLDDYAGELIHPGNLIELRDGLHEPSKIIDCMPEAWSGHIDLTMCHSAVAGHIMKKGRTDRRIIVRRQPVDPIVSLSILNRLYQELDTEPHNYSRHLVTIFKEVMETYNKSPYKGQII
jgi:hypothetical protein